MGSEISQQSTNCREISEPCVQCLFVVETANRHCRQKRVSSQQSTNCREISEPCVSTLDQQSQQSAEYGDGRLDDRQDGSSSHANKGCHVQAGLFVLRGDPVEQSGEGGHQVGRERRHCCVVEPQLRLRQPRAIVSQFLFF